MMLVSISGYNRESHSVGNCFQPLYSNLNQVFVMNITIPKFGNVILAG